MLSVKTPEEADRLLKEEFQLTMGPETVSLKDAPGRVLFEDVTASEYVPGFDRSTVDGYAVRSSDTFGCSEAIPSILRLQGEVRMGESASIELLPGCCVSVPTGGAIPKGADAMVMIEFSEDYGDGTIGILKSAAPGMGIIFKGDDVYPGKKIFSAGRKLIPPDIGALAAMGISKVKVFRKPVAGILSTGDELVPVSRIPMGGQIRDVNSDLLSALCAGAGAQTISYGIIKDEEALLDAALEQALSECDLVLISGGSSVGVKDNTYKAIDKAGEVLLHGIAMKPGKPTIVGKACKKPVFGLPGHPAAACFVAELFVLPVISRMQKRERKIREIPAILTEAISANDGRAWYVGVRILEKDGVLHAVPVHSKSGLITSLSSSDGYICIPRDSEGVSEGSTVKVRLYSIE